MTAKLPTIAAQPACHSAEQQAPVPDGGFFDRSGLLAYPVDPEVTVPHLLRIYEIEGTDGVSVSHNYDHSWFTAKDDTFKSIGGRALLKSMGQLIPIPIHMRKNRLFDRLSQYPASDDEIFLSLMNGLMGVVSPWVVDLSRPGNDVEDLLVRVDESELKYLTSRERFYREGFHKDKTRYRNRNKIGQFFVSYAISRGVPEDVSSTVTEQFLDAADKDSWDYDEVQQRQKLIETIIHAAMRNVATDVRLMQRRLVDRGSPSPKPRSPLYLMWNFVDRNILLDYQPMLEEALQAA